MSGLLNHAITVLDLAWTIGIVCGVLAVIFCAGLFYGPWKNSKNRDGV